MYSLNYTFLQTAYFSHVHLLHAVDVIGSSDKAFLLGAHIHRTLPFIILKFALHVYNLIWILASLPLVQIAGCSNVPCKECKSLLTDCHYLTLTLILAHIRVIVGNEVMLLILIHF